MGGTCEGTSWAEDKRVVFSSGEWKVVLDSAGDRLRAQIDRRRFRKSHVDHATVGDQAVRASAGAVAFIGDVAAGAAGFDLWTSNVGKLDRAAGRHDLCVNAAEIGHHHRCGQTMYVDERVFYSAHRDLPCIGRERNVAAQVVHCNGSGRSVDNDGNAGRDQDFVVDPRFFRRRLLRRDEMSANFNPPAIGSAVGIHFNFVGISGVVHYDLPRNSWLDDDRAGVVYDVDHAVGSHVELNLLVIVGGPCRAHAQQGDQDYNGLFTGAFHR